MATREQQQTPKSSGRLQTNHLEALLRGPPKKIGYTVQSDSDKPKKKKVWPRNLDPDLCEMTVDEEQTDVAVAAAAAVKVSKKKQRLQ